MRQAAFIVFVSVILLATCSAPEINPAPIDIDMSSPPAPTPGASVHPAQDKPIPAVTDVVVEPKLPESPFKAQIYINEPAGFALDYPAQCTVNQAVISSRGEQVQFLSSPELADLAILPEGATRLSATKEIWSW